jgi:hypothetical protein
MGDLVALAKETTISDFRPTAEFRALIDQHTNRDRVKAIHPEWTTEDRNHYNAQWTADRRSRADKGGVIPAHQRHSILRAGGWPSLSSSLAVIQSSPRR